MTFLVSKLLKYSLYFLQKLCCILWFFLSVKDLTFEYLFLSLHYFIISLCKFLVIKAETIYIIFIRYTGFYVHLKFSIYQNFYNCGNYLRLKFLTPHFELCYCQSWENQRDQSQKHYYVGNNACWFVKVFVTCWFIN